MKTRSVLVLALLSWSAGAQTSNDPLSPGDRNVMAFAELASTPRPREAKSAGMFRLADEREPIGTRSQDLFSMVHERYQQLKSEGSFIEGE